MYDYELMNKCEWMNEQMNEILSTNKSMKWTNYWMNKQAHERDKQTNKSIVNEQTNEWIYELRQEWINE